VRLQVSDEAIPPICVLSFLGPLRVVDGHVVKRTPAREWEVITDHELNLLDGVVL
jgi:hypothetical protein